jgi:PhzF family phenazine biosynthesis protein
MKYYHIDAFTSELFRGNPAGVCLLNHDIPDAIKQKIAAETGHPETAFVRKNGKGYSLRWFTPNVEVSLCGHATLAAAHALWQENEVPTSETIHFETLSGVLCVKKLEDGTMQMDFPIYKPERRSLPQQIAEAIKADVVECLYYFDRYLLELESEHKVRTLQPDHEKLTQVKCIVTAKTEAGSRYDFVSRFFAGAVGVPEDPVTGSAHCCLVPFWAAKTGKQKFLAYQASERGGELQLELKGDRVLIGGVATTFCKGAIEISLSRNN